MFNIGGGELLVILLIAFIVVGPENFPKVAQGIKKFLKSVNSFIKQAKEETGWDEVVKEVNETSRQVKGKVNDLEIKKEFDKSKRALEQEIGAEDLKKDIASAKKQINDIKHPVKAAASKLAEETESAFKQGVSAEDEPKNEKSGNKSSEKSA